MYKVVLAGRFNVGKSTLFNQIAGKRIAVESDKPGTTRDIVETYIKINDYVVQLIDTGGFEFDSRDPLYNEVKKRAIKALEEASLILFVVDRHQILEEDLRYIRFIQKLKKEYAVIVNKSERKQDHLLDRDIYSLGASKYIIVSAINKANLDEIDDLILENIKKSSYTITEIPDSSWDKIKVAIIGKPNVGKSSFFNTLVNNDKVIISDIPGTTIDSVNEKINFQNHEITFMDTAGIRRKKSIKENVEYYSIKRSLSSVDQADIVCLMVEYPSLIHKQDKKITDYILNQGKPFILIVNKIDLFKGDIKTLEEQIYYQFPHIGFIKIFFISVKEKKNITKVLEYIINLNQRVYKEYKTSELNKYIENCKNIKQILIGKSYLNLLYAVIVSKKPFTVLLFINKDPKSVPSYYTIFLINQLRKNFVLESIPVKILFRKKNG